MPSPSEPTRRPRRRPWLRDALVGGTLLVLSLVLLEIYARGQLVHTLYFVLEWLGGG